MEASFGPAPFRDGRGRGGLVIPEGALALALWTAYAGVAIGAFYLLAILVREWRKGDLW